MAQNLALSTTPGSPANSSFPSPLPASGSQRAPSIISSRMTDIASEDGNEFHSEGTAAGRRPDTAASNNPNRPGSSRSSATRPSTRPSTRAPPSRRGMHFPPQLGGSRMGGAFGGLGGSISNSSRPESSASKTSRSHIPALTSNAFFRPMSSQRLQAQRGAAQSMRTGASSGGSHTSGSNTNRHSLITNDTERPDPEGRIYTDSGRPPPSRGTAFTDDDEGDNRAAGRTRGPTMTSSGGSERPPQYAQGRFSPPPQIPLNVQEYENGRPQKATKSFGTNLLRNNGGTSRGEAQGHERLSSSASPTFSKAPQTIKPKVGVNYQYFSGNTIFFLGGRLQNTRDRPINVASGLIVLVPSILFLVFSYVQIRYQTAGPC